MSRSYKQYVPIWNSFEWPALYVLTKKLFNLWSEDFSIYYWLCYLFSYLRKKMLDNQLAPRQNEVSKVYIVNIFLGGKHNI